MRIVLATETFLPHVDGIVTRLTNTVAQLRAAGDDVLILAPHRDGSPTEFVGARVLTLPSARLPQYPSVRLGLPMLPFSVRRELKAFQPDVAHMAGTAVVGLGTVVWARNHKVPLVESYHVQYAEYVRRYHLSALAPGVWWYLRTLHNLAQLNLATSLPMVRELREHGVKHLHHWRPGVDAARFTPTKRNDAMRNRLSAGHPDQFLIVCVARLAVEKEIERLAAVLKTLPNVRLALVGDGPYRARLEQIFAGLPVTFMGMLRGDDLVAAYASADVFVLPSSTETLGLVALEAMAAGTPAIVADRGGLPDLVVDGQTGYLFDPDDPSDLTTHVLSVMQNPTKLQEMSHTARLHAERFSWGQTTKQLRSYYERVLQSFPTPVDSMMEDDAEPVPVTLPDEPHHTDEPH